MLISYCMMSAFYTFIHIGITRPLQRVVLCGYCRLLGQSCSTSVTAGVKTEMSLTWNPVGKWNGVFPMLRTQRTGLVTPWSPLPNASITQSSHELSAISLAWLYEWATPKGCGIKVLLLFPVTFPSKVALIYHIKTLLQTSYQKKKNLKAVLRCIKEAI